MVEKHAAQLEQNTIRIRLVYEQETKTARKRERKPSAAPPKRRRFCSTALASAHVSNDGIKSNQLRRGYYYFLLLTFLSYDASVRNRQHQLINI